MGNKRKQIPQRTLEVIETILTAEGCTISDLVRKDERPSSEWISMRETGNRLGLSVDTIKRRLKDNSFKGKKLNKSRNGSVRVLWSSVEDFLSKHDLEYHEGAVK